MTKYLGLISELRYLQGLLWNGNEIYDKLRHLSYDENLSEYEKLRLSAGAAGFAQYHEAYKTVSQILEKYENA